MKVTYYYKRENKTFESIIDAIDYFDDHAIRKSSDIDFTLNSYTLDNWLYNEVERIEIEDERETQMTEFAQILYKYCSERQNCVKCIFYDREADENERDHCKINYPLADWNI